jgi:hypothetical protein
MAPKLPPPAKTKAVFTGAAWLDTDKAPGAPGSDASMKSRAAFGGVYNRRQPGRIINIGCLRWPAGFER